MRKAFTVSERVAIAQAVAENLKDRQGGDRKSDQAGNISHLIDKGRTTDIAAAKAGLGSGKTYETAKKVVETGSPSRAVWRICQRIDQKIAACPKWGSRKFARFDGQVVTASI